SFAEPLKDIICTTMGISRADLDMYKNDAEPICVREGGDGYNHIAITDFRSILQMFGTDAMKKHFGQDVWVNLLIGKLPQSGTVIISDWRFEHEYELLKSYIFGNITTVRVHDDDLTDDGHASENDLNGFSYDYVLDNTFKVELDLQPIIDLI
ncbi:MAG: hypothetical protein KAT00_12235, partial [Planctomycetes bacterium]|nr:hypothetical protein [Planctomycetota bacterium]